MIYLPRYFFRLAFSILRLLFFFLSVLAYPLETARVSKSWLRSRLGNHGADGDVFFSPAIANTLLEDYMRQLQQRGLQDSYDLLTDREKEILQLLAEGRTNKEVAGLLNLSTNTVETHRTRIMQKLGLHSSAEIVLYAVRKRIIS